MGPGRYRVTSRVMGSVVYEAGQVTLSADTGLPDPTHVGTEQ